MMRRQPGEHDSARRSHHCVHDLAVVAPCYLYDLVFERFVLQSALYAFYRGPEPSAVTPSLAGCGQKYLALG
jgi:hypothetical protein